MAQFRALTFHFRASLECRVPLHCFPQSNTPANSSANYQAFCELGQVCLESRGKKLAGLEKPLLYHLLPCKLRLKLLKNHPSFHASKPDCFDGPCFANKTGIEQMSSFSSHISNVPAFQTHTKRYLSCRFYQDQSR